MMSGAVILIGNIHHLIILRLCANRRDVSYVPAYFLAIEAKVKLDVWNVWQWLVRNLNGHEL